MVTMTTTVSVAILCLGIGGYLMRWWLHHACQRAFAIESFALKNCLAAHEEKIVLRDRLANARSYATMLYELLAEARDEADTNGSYSYQLLEDPDFYHSEREQFLAHYVPTPSAPASDFYHGFERN